MIETAMTVAAGDGTPLAGTLSLPDTPGPHPAVLLLHGSGPLDRNGNARGLAMNLGIPLATALAASGIACLRYDRRGAGATPGNWQATGFIQNREDARTALETLAAHSSIRSDAVGLVGHSEGALHAMSVAAGAGPEVRAVVLLAGYARLGQDALRWQAGSLLDGMPAPVRLLRRPLAAIGNRILARLEKTNTDVARVAGFPVNARWMREMFVHDTRTDLAAIQAPVLAVTGDKDIQVDPSDLDEIARLVPHGAELHRIADLTHVLRRDRARHTVRRYRRLLREPVDPELLTLVTAWLAGQLPVKTGELDGTTGQPA